MDLETNKKICSEGFQLKNRYWIDKWGDEVLQLNPQINQWEDGNNVDGDGWSSDCIIEGGYTWSVTPGLNNKSYCVSSCGSGVFDGGIEQWDDKNQNDGDGWNNDCTKPLGFKCDHVGK